jgi:hypothetical protein
MRDQLGVVVGASERLDPLHRGQMLLRTSSARNLPVGDLPNKHMPKRELGLAGNGGATLPKDEPLALERMQKCVDVVAPDATRPEHLAEHRRVLQQPLLVLGKTVESCGNDPLHVLWNCNVAALEEQPRELRTAPRRADCRPPARGALPAFRPEATFAAGRRR